MSQLNHNTPQQTHEWYQAYYAAKGAHRNSILVNPEVLFQITAFDTSILRALQWISPHIDSHKSRVLDVGTGSGGSFIAFLRAGWFPNQLCGVDIQQERIDEARQRFPGITFHCADARSLPPQIGDVNIAFESTMFVQLTDDAIANSVAQEMLRIVRPKGFLLICDWRYSKPGNHSYKGVSKKRICNLFEVGTKTTYVKRFNGALIPPVGRFLSKYAGWLYFPVQKVFPFLVGQQTTILQRL